MILNLLDGNLPATHGVTLRAIGAKFSAVNVRVAIRAILADIREYRFDMALRAAHIFMHAAQRIICAVVIEFRNGANGAPTGSDMTIFTRDGERTVRASGTFFLGVGLRGKTGQGEN